MSGWRTSNKYFNSTDLSKIPLFSELSESDLTNITEIVDVKEYCKDNLILFEATPAQKFFIIKSGSVKCTFIDANGREVIVNILYEGDFFGEFSLTKGMSLPTSFFALNKTELYVIRCDELIGILEKYPTVSMNLIRQEIECISTLYSQIKKFSLLNAEYKVAATLIKLAEEIGTIHGGQVRISKLLRQQDIANIAGTSRETISRSISKFQKRGFVKRDKRDLIIFDYENFKQEYN